MVIENIVKLSLLLIKIKLYMTKKKQHKRPKQDNQNLLRSPMSEGY